MSGIAGIIHFDGRPVAPGQMEGMTAAMHYRGPDGINHWRKANVALGQCMLCTTPESEEEKQPLTNEDESLVLVMDGRVDNWEELRRDLSGKGAVLRTRADAELVLRAYEVWGRDCLSRIDGDFALVIWDARQQQAFCARDRVGNKPFNYHWDGRTFAFASDLHAVLRLPWVPEVLNEGVVAEYLAVDHQSRDETLWQGVMRLVPAHFMVVGTKGLRPSQYWTPDLAAKLVYSSDSEYIEHYRALFTDVVRRMARSNYPLACEVSGGLDSSAIFAVAETWRQQGALLAPGLEGYALDFSGHPDADEMKFSRAVGAHLGRTIHEVLPAFMPLAWYQDRARRFREFPGYPNGVMHLNILDEARRSGCRVLLGGTGGDEWLGGGPLCYAEALQGGHGPELLKIIHRDARDVGLNIALWRLLRFGVGPLLHPRIKQTLNEVFRSGDDREMAKLPWLSTALKARLNGPERDSMRAQAAPVAIRIGQQRQLELLTDGYITQAREIIERQNSVAGIEWRQPFWDRRIIEFALATPEHLRFRANESKWLHRRAMAPVLPPAVVHRSTKAEFTMALTRDWHQMRVLMHDVILPRRVEWVNVSLVSKWMQDEISLDRGPWSGDMLWMIWALLGLDAVQPCHEDLKPKVF